MLQGLQSTLQNMFKYLAMLRIIKLLCSAFINCETEDCSPGNGAWGETMLCNWAISASYQDSHFITDL